MPKDPPDGRFAMDATRNDCTDVKTPSFPLLDAVASRTTTDLWRLALNVSTLAGKPYAAVCPLRRFHGETRKVAATMGYRWQDGTHARAAQGSAPSICY